MADTVFVACGLAWCTSMIHVQAAIGHVSESGLYALFFALLAPLQFIWGLALFRRPSSQLLLRAGAVLSLAVAALWLASRTTGLPVGPEHWSPEEVGVADSLATADEIFTAILCLYPLALGASSALPRRTMKVVMAGGLVLILLSTLAIPTFGHVH
jgi:hypothetical protein